MVGTRARPGAARAARLAVALLAALLPGASAAQGVDPAPCRLALVLALDVSASVDAREDALQRQGLAAALRAPEVRAAFLEAGPPVAIAVFEWSGRNHQGILIDWQIIRDGDDLDGVSRRMRQSRRAYNVFSTAMGRALEFGAELLARGPSCLFRTIDVSGDGANNEEFGPTIAYAAPAFDTITVNGLVINAGEHEAEVTLIEFFRDEVLHGPGAFLEVAQGFDDYERAMTAKLVREVSARSLAALR